MSFFPQALAVSKIAMAPGNFVVTCCTAFQHFKDNQKERHLQNDNQIDHWLDNALEDLAT